MDDVTVDLRFQYGPHDRLDIDPYAICPEGGTLLLHQIVHTYVRDDPRLQDIVIWIATVLPEPVQCGIRGTESETVVLAQSLPYLRCEVVAMILQPRHDDAPM